MPIFINARISDEADLKLKELEIALRAHDPDIRRPIVIEAAILAADIQGTAADFARRHALAEAENS